MLKNWQLNKFMNTEIITKYKEVEAGTIPKGWIVVNFDKILSLEYGKALKEESRIAGQFPVYGSNGVVGFHNEKLVDGPGIIVGRKGSAGEIIYSIGDFFPIDTTYFVKTTLNKKFVYYLLKNTNIKKLVGSSAVPGLNRNDVYSQEIVIPAKHNEQKQIAEILSSLDDKIELNRKINANLEKLASLLFKKWFVDIGDELPEGWKDTTLGEFVPIKTGKKDANIAIQDGQYPFFTCSQDVLKTNVYSFDASALLLAGNGDFSVKWYEGKFEAYQRTYVLVPHKKELLGFLYYLVKYFLDDITAGHRGSVIRFITKGMIEDYKIRVPTSKVLEEKAKIFYEINQSIDFYKREIENLIQIRDSLLPRLMSGKIRVN
jgi:type I restriction enzyme S subunit